MTTRHASVAALLLAAACASGSGSGSTQWPGTPRPLATIPQGMRFVPDPAFNPSGSPLPEDRCLTRLIDERSAVRLTLVRSIGAGAREAARTAGVSTSANPQGDFSTEPQFSYGLRTGELLRVDCATGRALGAVQK